LKDKSLVSGFGIGIINMGEKHTQHDSADPNQHLRKPIIVDCSDWESDIPPEKWSRGQFITDPAIIAKHFEDKKAAGAVSPSQNGHPLGEA